MSKYKVWVIALVVMLMIMNFPLSVLSEDIPSIKADPSEINVTVKRVSTGQTEVTLKSTISEDKTIIFQDNPTSAFPRVDLYGQSMTIPANSIKVRSVIVDTGDVHSGSYNKSLAFYFQGDLEKKIIGTVTFHIKINDIFTLDWPLKAEPKFVNLSVPAGMSTVREIKLTNIADVPVVGTLSEARLKCVDVPYITILGDHSIHLEKNESIRIKVQITGATTSSSTCYELSIALIMSNRTMSDQFDVIKFYITTNPGIPLAVVLIPTVVIVALFVGARLKKKKRRPQANTISSPRP